MRGLKKIPLAYLYLLVGLVSLLGLYTFRYSSSLQINIILIAVVLYLIFAIFHHKKDKSLTPEVLIEYILLGILAFVLLLRF